jgi:hypothetical protein
MRLMLRSASELYIDYSRRCEFKSGASNDSLY